MSPVETLLFAGLNNDNVGFSITSLDLEVDQEVGAAVSGDYQSVNFSSRPDQDGCQTCRMGHALSTSLGSEEVGLAAALLEFNRSQHLVSVVEHVVVEFAPKYPESGARLATVW